MSKELLPIFSALFSFIALIVSIIALYKHISIKEKC
ncbi:Uncharacterised protein [Cedecea lapagei]|uniref:Uncharacterized protein n=1 Tax=Cedecea lapagei TaxID=158823 RepID=A0A3S4MBQ6_9ENTR|nr:Uncharacterised protein [Cedecea lapagei]